MGEAVDPSRPPVPPPFPPGARPDPNRAAPPMAPWVRRALPKPPLPVRAEVVRGLVVGAAMALLGAPLGVLWAFAVPHLAVQKVGAPAYLLPVETEDLASMGGDLVLIAIFGSVGVVAALAVHLWSSRAQLGPLVGLLLGGAVCGVIAMAVGHVLVEADYHAVFAHIEDGRVFQVRPYVRGRGDFLILPVFSALAFGLAQVPPLLRGRTAPQWAPPEISSGVAASAPGVELEPPPSS